MLVSFRAQALVANGNRMMNCFGSAVFERAAARPNVVMPRLAYCCG
jgi:hypothetical protein